MSRCSNESPIDERYRLTLINYYLERVQQGIDRCGNRKWAFICPFCGPLQRTDSKKQERKGVLLWNAKQHSWVFSCAKGGSVECMRGKTLSNVISALNPELGEAYKRDRWHSGTTGKGHNCARPVGVVVRSPRPVGIGSTGGVQRARKNPGSC
jgi:hypothetical protein